MTATSSIQLVLNEMVYIFQSDPNVVQERAFVNMLYAFIDHLFRFTNYIGAGLMPASRPTCAPTQPGLHYFEVTNFNPPTRGRRGGMDRNRP
jgi:hypothetical protein